MTRLSNRPSITTRHSTTSRLEGLDYARFLAFAGMVIVNFRLLISGDAPPETSTLDYLAILLEGRASATFVVLAGVGLGLAGQRGALRDVQFVTLKRAVFLLVLGLLNMQIFDADILHFYAFYFLFGALLLPLSRSGLVFSMLLVGLISIALLVLLDYDAGWDWTTLTYSGLWTPEGFVRHLFFNGWHPVFPWLSFLLLGMVLSRCELTSRRTQHWLIASGAVAIVVAEAVSGALTPWMMQIDPELVALVATDAVPPAPLYVLAGMGSALLMIGLCLRFSDLFGRWRAMQPMMLAGRQSLTLYIAHIYLGLGMFAELGMAGNLPVSVAWIAALVFCALTLLYVAVWSRYFKRGPLEGLMRRLAG